MVPFVKSVTNLADDDNKRLWYKRMHEGARKDVERTFGALKKKWAILTTLTRAYIKEKLANIMYTCIILHNTIIKDRMEAICIKWYPEKEHQPDDLIRSDEQRHRIIKYIKSSQVHQMLKADLIEHVNRNMNLTGYEVPHVLVTCRSQTDFIENCILINFMLGRQIADENDYDENVPLYYNINKDFSIPFGREKFCLVTGLRFGVQNWAEYDTKERIPFRRRVFPSYLDGQPITGIDIANMILDQSFAQLYDDDVVGLCCLGILQLVILGVESRRVVPDWMLRLANDRIAWDKYP
ncbi:phospholipase-like protein [Tanacetum coccineum]